MPEAISSLTILEADAVAQESLVDRALEEGWDYDAKNASDPYGAVLWPAASAVARRVLDLGPALRDKTVLELGAGTGLVSLAAASAGARDVLATDYAALPLRLLELAAKECQAKPLSNIRTALFDMCDEAAALPPAEVVVASDIMYEPVTGRAAARRVAEAYTRGSRIIVGDSPGRAGRPAFLETLAALLPAGERAKAAFTSVSGVTVVGHRHELICGATSTSVSADGVPRPLPVAILDLQREAPG